MSLSFIGLAEGVNRDTPVSVPVDEEESDGASPVEPAKIMRASSVSRVSVKFVRHPAAETGSGQRSRSASTIGSRGSLPREPLPYDNKITLQRQLSEKTVASSLSGDQPFRYDYLDSAPREPQLRRKPGLVSQIMNEYV